MKKAKRTMQERVIKRPKQAAKQTASKPRQSEAKGNGRLARNPRPAGPTATKLTQTARVPRKTVKPVSKPLIPVAERPSLPRPDVKDTRPPAPVLAPPHPLATLRPKINEAWLDALRLLKAAALRLMDTGEHLAAGQKLVNDDASWQERVVHEYPMSPKEAAALVRFARDYAAMRGRLSPAVATGLVAVLLALAELYVAVTDPDTAETSYDDDAGAHADAENSKARKRRTRRRPR